MANPFGQPGAFVGRLREIKQILDWIDGGHSRAVVGEYRIWKYLSAEERRVIKGIFQKGNGRENMFGDVRHEVHRNRLTIEEQVVVETLERKGYLEMVGEHTYRLFSVEFERLARGAPEEEPEARDRLRWFM